MFLTIPDALVQLMLDPAAPAGGRLYGRLRDRGDVAQVRGLDAVAGEDLGRWERSGNIADPTGPVAADGEILLLAGPPLQVRAFRAGQGQWSPVACNIIRLHADYGARLQGIFETGALAGARVAVIGLGTGGAQVAVQLARCGVGHMRLVDFDRLEVHNIARHVCGLGDIGRYKTRAVRDLLYDISPAIQVETYEADVLADADLLEQIVAGCDLVAAATDSEVSKLAINAACWPRAIPAVYGAAYNRAFGGDIFRAVPPEGPCYTCFQAVVNEFFGPPPAATSDFTPGYADPAQMADLIAEPGLGMDAGVIALLMARMCLMTLLRDRTTSLPDLPSNWLLFGNRAEWIFQRPLESIFVDVPKRADCPTCSYEAYVRENLGMSSAEAAAEAQRILAEIPGLEKTDEDQ